MSALLLGCWLVLNQSLSPGHLLLGSALALLLAPLFGRLRPPGLRLRRPGLILRLMGRVFVDILRSNIAVAAIILSGRWRGVTSGFVEVPLELTDRYALGALACIITSTPGTIWVRYSATQGVLLIHVFDLVDESEWIRTIDQRYQQSLKEIFG